MTKQCTLIVYQGSDLLWRWQLESPHGDLLAVSGKGYKHDTNLYRALGKVTRTLTGKVYRQRKTDYIR